MKNPRCGDIIEIPTPQGLAYAQYTHRYAQSDNWGGVGGDLIRALPGLSQSRPNRFSDRVLERETFITFFDLRSGVRDKNVTIVAHEKIPERCQQFPTFRQLDENGGSKWCLWDGKRARRVDELSAEQEGYPTGPSVGSFERVVERILWEEGLPSPEMKERMADRITHLCQCGEASMLDQDHTSAINEYFVAYETDRENKSVVLKLAEAYNARGLHRKSEGDRPSATADFKRALELVPRNRKYKANYESVI